MGSIPCQANIMNVPVFYHEVDMVFWTMFINVWRVIIKRVIIKRVIIMHAM